MGSKQHQGQGAPQRQGGFRGGTAGGTSGGMGAGGSGGSGGSGSLLDAHFSGGTQMLRPSPAPRVYVGELQVCGGGGLSL